MSNDVQWHSYGIHLKLVFTLQWDLQKHSKKRLNSEENGHLDTADSQIVENLPIKSNQSKAHNHFLHFRINLGGKPWSYQPLQTIWIWGKDITSSTASDKILPGHL